MMELVYVVRHAKAGSRERWDGDDTDRPLTKNGRAQAEALCRRLRPVATATLLSSPYLRCVQTLEPLAEALDAKVASDDRLTEGAANATHDPTFAERYAREQAKGLAKTAALNAVARKLAKVAWSIVTHGSTYDPRRVDTQPVDDKPLDNQP